MYQQKPYECFLCSKSLVADTLQEPGWLFQYVIVVSGLGCLPTIMPEASQYKADLARILHDLCAYKGVEILEGHLMPDHVHMLVSIPPKLSVSSFMGYLKGKSSLMMFDRHGNLKYKFGNRHFWSDGYYVSTVGLNDATIKKYIRDQERADILKDKMSVREYEDPFGAQPGKDPKINR